LLERTLELVGDRHNRAVATELVVRITSYQLMKQSTGDARRWLSRIDAGTIEESQPVAAEFYTLRATLHGRDGDDIAWRADFSRALEIYRRRGAGMFERYLNAEFGMQAIARGDLVLARQCFERAREASTESASTRNDVPLGMALVELHAGRLAAAASWLGRVEPTDMLQSRMLAASAGVALGAALADDAMMRAYLSDRLLDELAAHDDDFGFIKTACAFAEALIALGERSAGDALLERATARVATTFDMLPAIATIARLRPDLGARLTPIIAVRAGDPFHDATLALVESECAAAGQPFASRPVAARDGFAELGWTILAARAAELAGDITDAFAMYRSAGHVAGSRRLGRAALDGDAPSALGVLSARERELARMVAGGKSNRAAAAALAISEKTVEKHLTSIYAKLSLQSRAQLTAYVVGADAEGSS
jgi:DNA-binding CsgD family transcriptional regulator